MPSYYNPSEKLCSALKNRLLEIIEFQPQTSGIELLVAVNEKFMQVEQCMTEIRTEHAQHILNARDLKVDDRLSVNREHILCCEVLAKEKFTLEKITRAKNFYNEQIFKNYNDATPSPGIELSDFTEQTSAFFILPNLLMHLFINLQQQAYQQKTQAICDKLKIAYTTIENYKINCEQKDLLLSQLKDLQTKAGKLPTQIISDGQTQLDLKQFQQEVNVLTEKSTYGVFTQCLKTIELILQTIRDHLLNRSTPMTWSHAADLNHSYKFFRKEAQQLQSSIDQDISVITKPA
jgi:hypothetical protein